MIKNKGGVTARPLKLNAVVHLKFNWVRCHTHSCNVSHFEANVTVNEVIRKNTTFG